MYVYRILSVPAYIYIHMHMHIQIKMHTTSRTDIYIYVYICIYVKMYIYTYAYMYICNIYIYIYVCRCIYIYIYVYICTQTYACCFVTCVRVFRLPAAAMRCKRKAGPDVEDDDDLDEVPEAERCRGLVEGLRTPLWLMSRNNETTINAIAARVQEPLQRHP